jgi:hypothetical protein
VQFVCLNVLVNEVGAIYEAGTQRTAEVAKSRDKRARGPHRCTTMLPAPDGWVMSRMRPQDSASVGINYRYNAIICADDDLPIDSPLCGAKKGR